MCTYSYYYVTPRVWRVAALCRAVALEGMCGCSTKRAPPCLEEARAYVHVDINGIGLVCLLVRDDVEKGPSKSKPTWRFLTSF